MDLKKLLTLNSNIPLAMSFYKPLVKRERQLSCKVYHFNTPLALSDILPILENLGLRVLGEFAYCVSHKNGSKYWIHDFSFIYSEKINIDFENLNENLQSAFINIVDGHAESDAFNKLVIAN